MQLFILPSATREMEKNVKPEKISAELDLNFKQAVVLFKDFIIHNPDSI